MEEIAGIMIETQSLIEEQIEYVKPQPRYSVVSRPPSEETFPKRFRSLGSLVLTVLTGPVIYAGFLPMLLLDLFLTLYQALCFSVYGIPKVKRSDYLIYGRGRLKYLNWFERLNCEYCSYGNGLAAYFREVAGRTEQHWCPIKHARRVKAPHSRYSRFVDYGDAEAYRLRARHVRNDFVDLATLTRLK
jgi:hypothetical protein